MIGRQPVFYIIVEFKPLLPPNPWQCGNKIKQKNKKTAGVGFSQVQGISNPFQDIDFERKMHQNTHKIMAGNGLGGLYAKLSWNTRLVIEVSSMAGTRRKVKYYMKWRLLSMRLLRHVQCKQNTLTYSRVLMLTARPIGPSWRIQSRRNTDEMTRNL